MTSENIIKRPGITEDFTKYLLPFENAQEYENNLEALIDNLNPSGPLEMRQVELIALADLDIARYRKMLAHRLGRIPNRKFNHLIEEVHHGEKTEEVTSADFFSNAIDNYSSGFKYNTQIERQIKNSEIIRQRHIDQFYKMQNIRKNKEVEEAEVIENIDNV